MSFPKGQSGNPKGRPRGAANRTTAILRGRINAEADPIAFLATVMRGEPIKAPDGDGGERTLIPTLTDMLGASRILASKLVPDAKDSPIRFDLPEITSATDATAALSALLKATAKGELTPAEAQSVVNLVKPFVEAIQTTDLEKRVNALAERLGEK